MGRPPNPEERLNHQANLALLAALRAQAVPAADLSHPAWSPGGFELHTHPDLEERLSQLASSLRPHRAVAVYGCPVLATRAGVIFAFAWGLRFLAFRLAAADAALAKEVGAELVGEARRTGQPPLWVGLEPEWTAFAPWGSARPSRQWTGDLGYFCERALEHAQAL
jgi:hypothetical protein